MRTSNNMRILVRGAYDLQQLRVQMGNRIVGNFKVKLGQDPGTAEEDIESVEAKKILSNLRASYKKITDGVARFPSLTKFTGDGVIDTYTELTLVAQYFAVEQAETEMFNRIGKILEDYPIFTQFLRDVRGIGPAMAGVIISEIDIKQATYASTIWAYAGLDVAADGRGRSRKAEHLVTRKYIDKDGKEAERQGITFNPWLKTKLIGVLATSFIRAGKNKYDTIYRDYKHRLENMPQHAEKSKGHRDNMAKRYMIKMFLIDLYAKWRELEGLEVRQPYHVAKLNMEHHSGAA